MQRYISFFFVLLIGCSACSKAPEQVPQSSAQSTPVEHNDGTMNIVLTPEQVRVAGIVLGLGEERSMSGNITAHGMLDVPPQNIISISPHVGGFIQSITVLEGQFVRKGDVIAVLEHQDYIALQEEYIATKSKVDFLETEYKRQEILQKDNINATKTYQQVMAEYYALRGRVAGLEQRLRMLGMRPADVLKSLVSSTYTLTAPMDGYVTKVLTHRGKFNAPQDIICEIVNTDHLHAELMVFEKDVVRLRPHQQVHVRLSNVVEEQSAEIYLIGREVTQDRMVRVHVHLRGESKNLMPYTALTAVIETDAQRLWTVPTQAIVSSNGKEYIALARAPHHTDSLRVEFNIVQVERGISTGGFTAVTLPGGIALPDSIRLAKIAIQGAYALVSHAHNSGATHDH